jgi:hypothetical protein
MRYGVWVTGFPISPGPVVSPGGYGYVSSAVEGDGSTVDRVPTGQTAKRLERYVPERSHIIGGRCVSLDVSCLRRLFFWGRLRREWVYGEWAYASASASTPRSPLRWAVTIILVRCVIIVVALITIALAVVGRRTLVRIIFWWWWW